MTVINATAETFDQEVLKATQLVLVDFWAEWCGPCKALSPILTAVAEEYAGKCKIVKVNIDEAQSLAAEHGVRSIPTLLVFKEGKEIEREVGALPKPRITALIDSHL